METPKFEGWCVVEVMGHNRYAGYVTEQAIGGASFIRVDVPAVDGVPAFTKLLGGGSIFAITPCTEEIARQAAGRFGSRPLSILALPAPVAAQREFFDADDDTLED